MRGVAIKTSISVISEGKYIASEDSPHYVQTAAGVEIFRLHLVAIVLEIEKSGSITNLLVEDGTGSLVVRAFEELPCLKTLSVGDAIRVVGKLRMYNQEKYISPDLIKKTSPLWLKVRALEEGRTKDIKGEEVTPAETKATKIPEVPKEDPIKEAPLKEPKELLPTEKIMSIIKELDKGEGVQMEEVISKSHLTETENVLEEMLKKGEIFQISPGKVKVL